MSLVSAAAYDSNYYYFKSNARSRESIQRAQILLNYFGRHLVGRECLDFGSNDGSFVAKAASQGIKCEGVEINRAALKIARSHRDGVFWRPDELADRKFDCVTAFDVIEHFDELQEFFNTIARSLRKSGLLIITTPNKNSKWHRIFGDGWHGLGIPQYHRLVLSKQFLRSQLRKYGYEVEEMFTCAPIGAKSWKLLVASGYRLESGLLAKVGSLPNALGKFTFGKVAARGEDDTICVVARGIESRST
jgi:SAM-dependent methyltransferase